MLPDLMLARAGREIFDHRKSGLVRVPGVTGDRPQTGRQRLHLIAGLPRLKRRVPQRHWRISRGMRICKHVL